MRIWDAADGRLVQIRRLPFAYRPQSAWVLGQRALAAEMTKEGLECWDLVTGKHSRVLDVAQNSRIAGAAFSADGMMLAIAVVRGRQNCSILVRDLAAERTDRLYLRGMLPRDLAFTPDGLRLVGTFPDQSTVIAWDPATGEEVWRVNQFAGRLNLSAGGRWLLLNGPCATIWRSPAARWPRCYTIRRPAVRSDILISQAHDYDAISFALAADGQTFAVAFGSTVRVTAQGCRASGTAGHGNTHGFHSRWPSTGHVGRHVATLGSGYRQAALEGRRQVGPLCTDQRLNWSHDGSRIVSALRYPGHTLRLWEATNGQAARWEKPGVDWAEGELTFTAAGTPVSISTNSWLIAANPLGKDYETPLFENEQFPPGALDKQLTADGRRAVILRPLPGKNLIGALSVDWESNRATTPLRDTRISQAEKRLFFPYGRSLATAHRQLDPYTGHELPPLDLTPGDPFRHCPLAASADGVLLAAGIRPKNDGKDWLPVNGVAIWERATGKLVRVLKTGPTGCLAFAPDRRTLATAQPDGLRLWDAVTGEMRRFWPGHASFDAWDSETFAGCVAFSPDGQRLASGHPDTTILIWDVARAQVAALDATPESLWADLASADPAVGVAAVRRLATGGDKTIAFLTRNLQPAMPAVPAVASNLIAGLNSPQFAKREAASQQLADLGVLATPFLRTALKANPAPEQRRRLELLVGPGDALPTPRGEDLRGVCAVQVLERSDSILARKLLETLAHGADLAWQTRAALRSAGQFSPLKTRSARSRFRGRRRLGRQFAVGQPLAPAVDCLGPLRSFHIGGVFGDQQSGRIELRQVVEGQHPHGQLVVAQVVKQRLVRRCLVDFRIGIVVQQLHRQIGLGLGEILLAQHGEQFQIIFRSPATPGTARR